MATGSIQTQIGKRGKGYKGGIANSNPKKTENSTAEADLGIGKFCKYGTTGHVPLTAINETPSGVVMKSDIFDGVLAIAGEAITICKGGSIFVYTETACVKDTNVFVRCVANGALEIGDVRNDADTDKAVEMTNIKFAESLAGAGLVEIEIN
jgi:hypothetical protein